MSFTAKLSEMLTGSTSSSSKTENGSSRDTGMERQSNTASTSVGAFSDENTCLDGNLKMRKGRASGHGSVRWKERYVFLNFVDGGSLSVFEESDEQVRHRQHRSNLLMFVPGTLSWEAKDVKNTPSTFAIEIPTDEGEKGLQIAEDVNTSGGQDSESHVTNDDDIMDDMDESVASVATEMLQDEMANARKKRKPVRIYFKCTKGSNQKALWLEAFAHLGRLSDATRRSSGIRSAVANGVRLVNPYRGRARKRTQAVEQYSGNHPNLLRDPFDEEDDEMDGLETETGARINQMVFGKPMKRNEENEYKVIPGYAYPHRWMSIRELHEEMMLPSTHFHDLRDPNKSDQEIGCLRVEVLQCVGLPRLDRASDTDGVVYLVCGPCAFATDVIPDRTNPMWLRKTRRACIFPVFHGYARLYVGVFDDDGEKAKDDFAGRVVVDIARLRHGSTYDVTMPLRMSTHAYARRPRGAVRLRFTLEVKSEKDVMLSYIPKKIKIVPPQRSRPDLSTTIACADATAFRNIAITVHSEDMPDRFSFTKIKAAIKEMSFTIKFMVALIRQEIKDTKAWVNPTMSGFIFSAWMHCIWRDSFSLVPGYVGLYVFLQLMRTYAIYAVQGPMHAGFIPPTWEEMLEVLISPRSSTSIEPLAMNRKSGISMSVHGSFHGNLTETMEVKTHKPMGLFLFKCLGFIPWNDDAPKKHLHLEFPFSDGTVYEKFKLKECLADTRAADEAELDDDEEDEFESSSRMSFAESERSDESTKKDSKTMFQSVISGSMTSQEKDNNEQEGEGEGSGDEGDEDEQSIAMYSDEEDGQEQLQVQIDQTVLQNMTQGAQNMAQAAAEAVPLPVNRNQDLLWKNPNKRGKREEKLPETLNRISYKMHSITFHSFHDHVYHIKNPDSVYFSEPKLIHRRKNKTKVDRKLNKLLEVKEFSHSRPIISRVGLIIEPLISAIYAYICVCRSLFNLTTWQDPFLSFLLSVAVGVITLVLFLIPWRPVLFIIGLVFVGPQNWVVRILRERGVLPPKKPRQRKEEEPEKPDDDQMVFYAHRRSEGILAPKPPPPVDPLEVQHIVVPYGHLMYQRFFDWPPEQQYATVVPAVEETQFLDRNVSMVPGLKSSAASDSPKAGSPKRFQRLRRRFNKQSKKEDPEMSQVLEADEEQDESSNNERPSSKTE